MSQSFEEKKSEVVTSDDITYMLQWMICAVFIILAPPLFILSLREHTVNIPSQDDPHFEETLEPVSRSPLRRPATEVSQRRQPVQKWEPQPYYTDVRFGDGLTEEQRQRQKQAAAEERRRYEYSRQIKELEMLRMRSSMHNNIPYSYPEDMSDLGRTQYYDRQIENIKRMRGY